MTKSQIEAQQHAIVTLCRDAFTPPPYNKPEAEIDEFAQSLLTQLDREAYKFVAAFEGVPGELVGFAYGYASRAVERIALDETRFDAFMEGCTPHGRG